MNEDDSVMKQTDGLAGAWKSCEINSGSAIWIAKANASGYLENLE